MEKYILEARGIHKSFSKVHVLKGINFTLKAGEIHAICGENGAGKSTLMNIIDGVLQPDQGEIRVGERVVKMDNPRIAQDHGIQFVHQEIALCPDVTVAENIYMAEVNRAKDKLVKYAALKEKAGGILSTLSDISPGARVGDLNISNQQIVEIAKALSMECKILILDEPTAALSESESESLFRILAKLKAQGIGIIYISHRMSEIFTQCDRVTILRDGVSVATHYVSDVDKTTIVNQMVGRELKDIYPPKAETIDKARVPLFEVESLSAAEGFENLNLQLYRGEVLGIAGLMGAGRSEFAQLVCGLRKKENGQVLLNGEDCKIRTYKDAIDAGIVYLTEDRKQEGLFLDMPINRNISALDLDNVKKSGLLDSSKESRLSEKYIEMLKVRCRNGNQLIRTLSGGNQQKVLLAKLLTVNPKIIILDEPTRGIDVGAKSEIHQLIRSLANEGIGIIVISSELPEVIGICDRVMVMHEQRFVGEVTGDEINEQRIIHYASGIIQ